MQDPVPQLRWLLKGNCPIKLLPEFLQSLHQNHQLRQWFLLRSRWWGSSHHHLYGNLLLLSDMWKPQFLHLSGTVSLAFVLYQGLKYPHFIFYFLKCADVMIHTSTSLATLTYKYLQWPLWSGSVSLLDFSFILQSKEYSRIKTLKLQQEK